MDCALFEPSSGVIGQSWHVDLQLTGSLDESGLVYDFGHLKKLVRQVMHDTLDHALLIPVSSQFVNFEDVDDSELWQLHAKCKLSDSNFVWEYKCPEGAVFPIRSVALRPAIIEQEFAKLLKHRLPSSVSDVTINFREEEAEETAAFFRYTHGIAKHDGLCQRIFHGHRSRVEVYVGSERRADLEHYVAREMLGSDVHITTPSQVIAGNIETGMRGKVGDSVTLAFQSTLGKYEATLPADKVFAVEQETSIECIAYQIARILRSKVKTRVPVKVKIYEGIDKGAFFEL